jgi:hypothetical protein
MQYCLNFMRNGPAVPYYQYTCYIDLCNYLNVLPHFFCHSYIISMTDSSSLILLIVMLV